MKSIVIIIPYFGLFPKQFMFWLQSAYNNPSVNFLLFTDNEIESKSNIKVVKITFVEFRNIIQSKFDFEIALTSPYKICDYRGAFGFVFSDYLEGYDFWGFGDLDLVYGDIRHFLTDEILSKFKVILGYGHLTLYKNDEDCNHFFETRMDGFQYFKDVFKNPRNSLFDEFLRGGLSDMWKFKHPNLIWDYKPFDDILIPLVRFNFKSVFSPEIPDRMIFEYSEKKLFRIYLNQFNQLVKEQTLYAHFQLRKFMRVRTDNTEKYLIIPNSYIPYTQISASKIKKWSNPFEIYAWVWKFKYRVNKRLFHKKYVQRQNIFYK